MIPLRQYRRARVAIDSNFDFLSRKRGTRPCEAIRVLASGHKNVGLTMTSVHIIFELTMIRLDILVHPGEPLARRPCDGLSTIALMTRATCDRKSLRS